jgi:hypothetical protein
MRSRAASSARSSTGTDVARPLRRIHTCEIRSTSAIDSPLCGRYATTTRTDWIYVHWTCPEHERRDAIQHPAFPIRFRGRRRNQ